MACQPNFGSWAKGLAAGPNPVTRPGTVNRWTGSAGIQNDARAGLWPGHGLAPESICAAERMDIGHGSDKCVPVDWLVLMAASV